MATVSFPSRRAVLVALALTLAAPGAAAGGALELLMVEQQGCLYCARWDAEVAPAYPNTDEGRAAPLRRVQLRDMPPAGVALDRPATFTPTFILLDDAREVGRIEGYPGAHFFWPMLARLIAATTTQP